ncbi:MAG: chromate transporter [Clostridiaceae bacterium]|nr:chromate transporter [Clostridiaceae bacterium]
MGMLTSILRIGFVGFGGGSALIPVIEKAVVEEDHLLRKKEYDKDVIVASITPGALPVEIATGLGMHGGKISEMIAAALCMAFPGAFFTVLLISVLAGLNHVLMTQIECLSIGITAFICCMLTDYTKKTLREARKESKGRFHRALLILAGVFLLTCWKNIFKLFGINGSPFFHFPPCRRWALHFLAFSIRIVSLRKKMYQYLVC